MEDVKRQTEIKIEQHQREFYLRQQLRAIQAELGEADPGEKEAVELLQEDRRGEAAGAGRRRRRGARRSGCACCRRRRASTRSSARTSTGSSSLPWNKRSGDDEIELKKVEEALDDRHYGLERGEGAHHRVPRRAQAARRRSARPDPLLRRPAGHRQDVARRGDRDGDRARVLSHLGRRRARRGRDSRPSPHVRRRDAGPADPGAASRAGEGPGPDDRRDRQDVGRRPIGRSDGGDARGARPVAERRRSSITT